MDAASPRPAQSAALPRIKSPCISVCTVNPATRHCDGCGRTLKEIAQWSRLDDATRAAIMAELPERREKLAAGDAPT